MTSAADFEDGSPVGRSAGDQTPPAKRASTAFGSPGTDTTVHRIDLNEALIRHPDATYVMRAAGCAMHDAGIDDGDVLLVDRAVAARHGAVIIAVVAGEMVCRRLELAGGAKARVAESQARLVAASSHTQPIVLSAEAPLEVWGVVTTVIKRLEA